MVEISDQGTVYVEGYFSDRSFSGERPKFGYPSNHLPEPKVESMQVVVGYLAKPSTES